MAWNRPKGDFVINRYPICAAWYYVVAQNIGYTEEEAKSLGIARATFFAAAKNGFKKGHGKKSSNTSSKSFPKMKTSNPSENETDVIHFCGLETTIDPSTCNAIFGGEIIEPEKFDKSVKSKFLNKVGDEGYEHLINEMRALASKYTAGELNSKLSYQLYTGIRDEFRKKEFYAS